MNRHKGDGFPKGTIMRCNFNLLLQLLDKQLELDEELEAYDHLDQCEICQDTIYQLSRDRDQELYIYPGHSSELPFVPYPSVQQEALGVRTGDI